MRTVYEAAGGADGLFRLAGAWHAGVMADEVVSHAFSHGFHPDHTRRLAAYWAEALGGPTAYSDLWSAETGSAGADVPSGSAESRSCSAESRSCSAESRSCSAESTVVRMHSGNGTHEEMDRRAIRCFDEALVDVGLADDDRLRQVLHDYFVWATTTTMARYPGSADDVPDGLRMPAWSWEGLVDQGDPSVVGRHPRS